MACARDELTLNSRAPFVGSRNTPGGLDLNEEYAIHLPSGDHAGVLFPMPLRVTRLSSAPSQSMM